MPSLSLSEVIQQAKHISSEEKQFLLNKLPTLNPLEQLKLRQSLQAGQIPAILANLSIMRSTFYEQEKPKAPDPITNLVEKFIPKKPREPVSKSIFSKPYVIGGPAPHALPVTNNTPIKNLNDLAHISQLSLLHPSHITFSISENADQLINSFLQKVSTMFMNIEDIGERRNYFMNYMQSPMFRAYLDTGITCLRHPEIKPRQVSLNILSQIDPKYMNNRQFQLASLITAHIRSLCAI